MKITAIDLGSNTCRVVQWDCDKNENIGEYERIVRTADSLHESGVISDEAVDRIINTILEAQKRLGFEGKDAKAVTTAAMRIASNGTESLEKIREKTGVVFELIDGEEEARLTSLAVENALSREGVESHSFTLIDIGGGSTEISFIIDGEIVSKSFDIGILTVAQKFKELDAIRLGLKDMFKPVKDYIDDFYIKNQKPISFVATAGTPTTVAAMKLGQTYATYDSKKINGTILEKDELDIYLNKLLSMEQKEREIAVGVGRDDLIAAGIIIFEDLYEVLGYDECVVIDDGLREGVAIDRCKSI